MNNTVTFFSNKHNKTINAKVVKRNKRTVICEIDGKLIKKRYNQLETK